MGSAGWEEASSRNQNQSSWSCPYLRLQALKTRCREVLASPATLGAHYPAPQLHYDSLPLSWPSLEAGKGHCEPLRTSLRGDLSTSPAASRQKLPRCLHFVSEI